MSVNKVILLGRLGKDPEIKTISENTKVANVVLATYEKFKKQTGEYEEVTEWHNLVFWNKSAETAEKLLVKGTMIYVEGKLSTRKWEDKQGVSHYTTSIRVEVFKLISGGKPRDAGSNTDTPAAAQRENFSDTPVSQVDDDLPF